MSDLGKSYRGQEHYPVKSPEQVQDGRTRIDAQDLGFWRGECARAEQPSADDDGQRG